MSNDEATILVDVITRDCWYSGSVVHRGFRLTDILNDGTSDILTMFDAVTGIVGTGTANVRWKQVLLRKDRVLMAIPKGSHEAPIRRRNNYLEKNQYGAMIVLPGHLISGIVHLPSRGKPAMLLEENSTLSGFMPVTDVTVHNSNHDFAATRFNVAIIQRRFIESVQLTLQRLPKRESPVAESGATESVAAG